MIRSSKLQKLPVDSLVVPQSVISFKTGPFVERNTAEFTNVSCCTSFVQHTLYTVLQGTFSPFPPATIFSSLCVLKSPKSLPGGSSFGTLGVVCFSAFEGHQNLTWLLSGLLISKTSLPHAGTSCTLLFCL